MSEKLRTIAVTGADAKSFLQGQLSNDLERLAANDQQMAAWCTPKGRVIALFSVTRTASGYLLEAPADLADSIISRLTMFRFRAKVEFVASETTTTVDLEERIRAGIPFVDVEQSEKFTPHMLNLDLLDAISLDKGCYTGQEIVARTHYKGATKRRTLRFESQSPVNAGDKISDGTRDIGEVLNAAGNQLLAVLPTQKADGQLFIEGAPIEQRDLPYL